MSEENAPTSESSAETTPNVRRISNPRPKKSGRNPRTGSPGGTPARTEGGPEAPPATPAKPTFPVFDSPEAVEPARESPPDEPAAAGDWPDPEPASSGIPTASENPKRKRRRKKGKGSSPQNSVPVSDDEAGTSPSEPAPADTPPQAGSPQSQQTPPGRQNHPQQRVKLDSEALSKLAWKIYLSEVSEEGVALIGDNDAKELSRRCFRLAEIFMEEQVRRR